MIKVFLALFVLIEACSLFSQMDTTINFKLPALKIAQIENGKSVVYEFDNPPNRFSVNDSFLTANPQKYNYKVNIRDVNKITVVRSANLVPIMVFCFAIGCLIGSSSHGIGFGGSQGYNTQDRIFNALGFGLAFSLITGGIVLLISHDKEYDLSKYELIMKKKFLLKALKDNKLE